MIHVFTIVLQRAIVINREAVYDSRRNLSSTMTVEEHGTHAADAMARAESKLPGWKAKNWYLGEGTRK